MLRERTPWGLLLVWLVANGCTLAQVQVDVVSERTALENQVLGTYNALDRELLLVASVRGVDPSGQLRTPAPRSRAQQEATLAVQTLAFHADDVEAFKRLGWVGEDNRGLLAPRLRGEALSAALPPALAEFARSYGDAEFRAVVADVNAARERVMARVIELNADLTAADLPRVRAVFARLNTEGALSGDWVQSADGTWSVVP